MYARVCVHSIFTIQTRRRPKMQAMQADTYEIQCLRADLAQRDAEIAQLKDTRRHGGTLLAFKVACLCICLGLTCACVSAYLFPRTSISGLAYSIN